MSTVHGVAFLTGAALILMSIASMHSELPELDYKPWSSAEATRTTEHTTERTKGTAPTHRASVVGVKCENGDLIPTQRVDDGYCDCEDASGADEPGTAACSYYSVGRKTYSCGGASRTFASRVGDGVDDCGSDER